MNLNFTYIPNMGCPGGKSDWVDKTGKSYHVEVKNLRDIDVRSLAHINKTDLPAVQCFTSSYRVTNDCTNWDKWNGFVIADIDSKLVPEFKEKMKDHVFANKFCTDMHKFMSDNFFENYVCFQLSASASSFHYFFYFDVDRMAKMRKQCAQYVNYMVLRAYEALGYKWVTDYVVKDKDGKPTKQSVIDKCTERPVQLIYISGFPIVYNSMNDGECSGFFDNDEFEELKKRYETVKSEKIFDTSDEDAEDNIEYKFDDIIFSKIPELTKKFEGFKKYDNFFDEWNYLLRWRILNVLINIYDGDIDKITAVYIRLIDDVLVYKADPARYDRRKLIAQMWRDLKNNGNRPHHYGMNGQVLDFFKKSMGLKFKKKFRPVKLDIAGYDEEIILDSKQTITDVIYDIYKSDHMRVHITAGCGYGKTYAAKSLSKLSMMDDIELLMNSLCRGIRICFVAPMTSINRGSFESVEGWEIIDGEHVVPDKYRIITDSSLSICTTWTSFSLYKMYEKNFDVFIFDEIHSLYLYDYRTDIKDIKSAINMLGNKKVIMMTGTPSMELYEFPSYKIKITRPAPKVKCDLVFYNSQYNGYIYNDLREWIEADKNHQAVIFCNEANESKCDRIETYYKIHVDRVYNSKFIEDVKYITENESFDGQVCLCSVFGQAGINIYGAKNKKLRIYILNHCGIEVIQYANRIRNKECIDKVVVPYKIDDINNMIPQINDIISTDKVNYKIDRRNKTDIFQHTDDFGLKFGKNKKIINLQYGLNSYYINVEGGKYVLDKNAYSCYELIKRVLRYESHIQILYNRLINNDFDVNIIELEKDIPDDGHKKCRMKNRLGEQLIDFDFSYVKEKHDGSKWLDIKNTPMYKTFGDDTTEYLEKIMTYLCNNYSDLWQEIFLRKMNDIYDKVGRIMKHDIELLWRCYDLNNALHDDINIQDTYYIARMLGMIKEENDDLVSMACIHTCLIYEGEIKSEIEDVAEETYNILKEYKKMVDKYKQLIDTSNLSSSNISVINKNIENRKKIYSIAKKFLREKHINKGKSHKEKKIKIEGIVYNSIKDACDKLKKSRVTINRWIKIKKAEFI